MRKLVVSEFVTLDGVMEAPGGEPSLGARSGWTIPYWGDDIGDFKTAEMLAAGALLLGRVTYQGFAAAWPGRTDEGGLEDPMNNYPKHVASTTLNTVEWNNSSLIRGNVAEEIARLKQLPGKDILVYGSCGLVQSLRKYDLVDQYNLLVYPVTVGIGKQLFDRADQKQDLKLKQTKAFSSGVVLMVYQV